MGEAKLRVRCSHQVTNIIVQVLRLLCTSRNAVDIHIVYFAPQGGNPGDAAFLCRFTQGCGEGISTAICMPARLQPTPQLAVQGEQRLPAIRAEQPCRARDVPCCVAAAKAIRCLLHKVENPLRYFGSLGMRALVAPQLFTQLFAVVGGYVHVAIVL